VGTRAGGPGQGQEVGFLALVAAPKVGLKDLDQALGLKELDDTGVGRAGPGGAGVAAGRGQSLEIVRCEPLGDQAPETALQAKGPLDEQV
jgi:hypothetical protein